MEDLKVEISEPSTTEKVLEVEVARERLQKLFDDKVRKYRKEIRLNGFRQGNVPKQVVASRFREPIMAESIEQLVQDTLKEACKKHNIEPVAPGSIEKLEHEAEDKPVTYQAKLEVDPDLELGEYKFPIDLKPAEVTDEDVEQELEVMRKKVAESKEVERPAQEGDQISGHYHKIVVDGEEKPLSENSNFEFILGEGGMKEVHNALVGTKKGETKAADFTFPEDFQDKEVAGKTAQYTLHVESVKEIALPELNDEFAEKVSQEKSLDELRKKLRENLTNANEQAAKNAAYEEGVRKLIEANPFDIPKSRVQKYLEYRMQQQQQEIPEGIDLTQNEELVKQAEFALKRQRLLDEISKKEKIKAKQSEVDQEIMEMSSYYGLSFEDLKSRMRQSGSVMEIRENIKARKTLDFVVGLSGEEEKQEDEVAEKSS